MVAPCPFIASQLCTGLNLYQTGIQHKMAPIARINPALGGLNVRNVQEPDMHHGNRGGRCQMRDRHTRLGGGSARGERGNAKQGDKRNIDHAGAHRVVVFDSWEIDGQVAGRA